MKSAIQSLLARVSGVDAARAWIRERLRALERQVQQVATTAAAAETRVADLQRDVTSERQRAAAVGDQVAALGGIPERVAALEARIAQLEQFAEASDRIALRFGTAAPDAHDLHKIREHVRRAVRQVTLDINPGAHIVVDDVLPGAYYDLLLETLPPPEYFAVDDAVKQDFRPSATDRVPVMSRLAWQRFEQDVVEAVLMPALLEAFRPAINPHYAAIVGEEFAAEAAELPKYANGRVMLRRPGYRLPPHVDPKRRLITGILYLARTGDAEDYGTSLYRVDRPFVAPGLTTYYPEKDGIRCELVKRISFRRNRLIAFINSGAAHGAEIPPDAAQTERYAYQFSIRPLESGLRQLIHRLPAERQQQWRELVSKSARGAPEPSHAY